MRPLPILNHRSTAGITDVTVNKMLRGEQELNNGAPIRLGALDVTDVTGSVYVATATPYDNSVKYVKWELVTDGIIIDDVINTLNERGDTRLANKVHNRYKGPF